MNAHEEQFAKHFIVKQKRQRYLDLLSTGKGRPKAIAELDHFRDLEESHASLIPPNKQTVDQIYSMLLVKGATKTCYVISTNPEIDAREMPLEDALEESVGY